MGTHKEVTKGVPSVLTTARLKAATNYMLPKKLQIIKKHTNQDMDLARTLCRKRGIFN